MKTFAKLSYKGQVFRLRKLAERVLRSYSIKVAKIKFINHGENTTFKITDSRNRNYLLRICRHNYHTKQALNEELQWVEKLSSQFQVPKPVLSKNKVYLEWQSTEQIPEGRNAALFHWTEGAFLSTKKRSKNKMKPHHMLALGHLIGQLHKHKASFLKVKHRNYWTTEGLIGTNSRFGNLEQISQATALQQKLISKARKQLYESMKRFEKKYPQKLGFIHADLHFGNLIFNNNQIGIIDFDDSGFGFFAYDLSIPVVSITHSKILSVQDKIELRNALMEGYKKVQKWTLEDEDFLNQCMLARKLLMIAWLNSRSDNPKLRKYMKTALKEAVTWIKKNEKGLAFY